MPPFVAVIARLRQLRILLLLLGLGLAQTVTAMEVLRILAWPGYADPDVVVEFERRHNIRVEVSYIDSDDGLWNRIHNNSGKNFDVFAVNTAELQRYIDQGLTVPINLDHVKNHARQLPRFQDYKAIPGLVRNGQIYAVPYTYSDMGLIYNRKKVKKIPQSISEMWDPDYRGRVLAYNASNHNFSIAGLAMGVKNPFALNPGEFKMAVSQLIKLRRNVLTFYTTPEEVVKLYLEHDIVLIFGNYGMQQVQALRAAGADVGYVIPREGALSWLDCWVITPGAKNKTLAESWIDFMLEKTVSDTLTKRHGLANTITPFQDNSKDKIIWLEPLENYAKREALWSRIISGDDFEKF
ncbi:extracellular solute-binding protein [Undibacterium arcticum]|uniref:Extracellular solute-binding protein n=1 Tax=Undibacterium arcticum TaxID=1762892 RepID=A0ABV7EZK0_9BURK